MPEAKKISEVLRISLEEAEALKDDRPGPVLLRREVPNPSFLMRSTMIDVNEIQRVIHTATLKGRQNGKTSFSTGNDTAKMIHQTGLSSN